ncbi:helix-turn-helix transcriptional regulator [Clostridium perfringens]|uniref:helix-turn-helix transcriptional regulator n=1 Tax=Clostridium perfringens TaxID=1502 RepID=UPI0038FD085C
MSLAEKLQLLRNNNRLSQEELAEKLGISRQAISKWELGQSTPDFKEVNSNS